MLAFYRKLRAGMGKAEVLSAAQSEMRERNPHPRIWAAFTLTGDPGRSPEGVRASVRDRILETTVIGIVLMGGLLFSLHRRRRHRRPMIAEASSDPPYVAR